MILLVDPDLYELYVLTDQYVLSVFSSNIFRVAAIELNDERSNNAAYKSEEEALELYDKILEILK